MKRTSDRLREIFLAHRRNPKAPFIEDAFLEFLLDPPPAKGSLRNSFRGLRRLNAFMQAVEMEFAICFSQADFEKNWSLSDLAEKIEERQKNLKAQLSQVQKRIKEAERLCVDEPIKFGLFIGLPLAVIVWLGTRSWIVTILLIALVITGTFWINRNQLAFYRKLANAIQKKADLP